jgi:hypothetical protein
MKKLLLIIPFLWGCEKIEFPSQPSVAGEWIFTDYKVSVVSSRAEVQVIQNDTICINSFYNQSTVSGGFLMKQNYNLTSVDRRFIKGQTFWNFSGSYGSTMFPLYIKLKKDLVYRSNDYLVADFPLGINMRDYSHMVVKNHYNGNKTDYTFLTDGIGAAHSRKLTIVSPVISTDLYLSDGRMDRAVNVVVTLIFTRN